jgi:hypothetical protein
MLSVCVGDERIAPVAPHGWEGMRYLVELQQFKREL